MDSVREEDIAVIGMSGRFPGASSVEKMWSNSCLGLETIHHFTKEELKAAGVAEHWLNHPDYVRAKGIVDQVDLFDADFFGMSEQDAALLDPQQRLFILCAWEAFENAGYAPKQMKSRVGVFASTGMSLYLINQLLRNPSCLKNLDEYQILLGNDKDFLATRVSYLLNLKGPSLTLQTGCSSSLVCIHYAVQSLLAGECDLALAGGVSITIPQEQGYLYRKNMIGSIDGHCYAFDKRAQGTVKSNGVGTVLLKPLSEAIADQDTVYAVIRGSAINNDGAQKVGYTAPSPLQQTAVIQEAMRMAEVEAESIAYIETHGTGTILGDPIELTALKAAFSQENPQKTCALASLKTNIGHLDVAAGVAGFIRVCLALYHGKIPPSLNFTELNPKITLENSPFYINTALQDWPQTVFPRRASISAFGVGGTNVHMVLQAPSICAPKQNEEKNPLRFPISAKTLSALQRNMAQLIEHCKQNPETNLSDLAFTLKVGRESLPYCVEIVARDLEEWIKKACAILNDMLEGKENSLLSIDQCSRVQHHVNSRQSIARGRRIPLPTYSWDLKRYWIDNPNNFASYTEDSVARPEKEIEDYLQSAWKSALGKNAQSGDEHFFKKGGHSLSAVHFIEQLPLTIRSHVQAMHLYQYPTFSQILQYVQSQLASAQLEGGNEEQFIDELSLFSEGREL